MIVIESISAKGGGPSSKIVVIATGNISSCKPSPFRTRTGGLQIRKLLSGLAIIAISAVAITAFTGAINADGDSTQLGFSAHLSGAQEVPGVGTDMTGNVLATFTADLSEVALTLNLEGIAAANEPTRAHFHCAFAGANGPIAFGIVDPGPAGINPADLAAGELEDVLTNADFNLVDCIPNIGRPVSNIAALAFAMRDGLIYINVHTPDNPGGEVRGQLVQLEDD